MVLVPKPFVSISSTSWDITLEASNLQGNTFQCVYRLNAFLHRNSVSPTHCPKQLPLSSIIISDKRQQENFGGVVHRVRQLLAIYTAHSQKRLLWAFGQKSGYAVFVPATSIRYKMQYRTTCAAYFVALSL